MAACPAARDLFVLSPQFADGAVFTLTEANLCIFEPSILSYSERIPQNFIIAKPRHRHRHRQTTATSTMSSHPTRQSLAPSSMRSTSASHSNHTSHSSAHSSSSAYPQQSSRLSTLPTQASKQRQLSHLNSQLAQLTAHMSDLENLLRMTAVQAEGMRGLGGYAGGMFMAASKVLGEEAVKRGEEGK